MGAPIPEPPSVAPMPDHDPDFPTVRRLHSQGVLILGGGRALLMQVAHPLVARGVVEHSAYREDRIGRLLRTLRPMYAIAFGTAAEARTAGEAVRARHRFVVGEGYAADDEDLQRWILATLIDTSLLMHRRFVGPVQQTVAEDYYLEMCQLGEWIGLRSSAMPGSLDVFESYLREMVPSVEVTADAHVIASELFAPLPGAPWLSPAMPLVRQLTAGLLPRRLREAYGFGWGPRRARTLVAAQRLSRLLLPHLPDELVDPPGFLMPQSWRERRRSDQ